jgi:hypothetical protein
VTDEAPDVEHIALTSICRNRECPAKRHVEGFRSTAIILASWRPRYGEYRCLWCDGKVETIETEEEVRGTKL